jgi:hypothetical protein
MKPHEIDAFLEAYSNNVASLSDDLVRDFVTRYESGEDIDYCGEYTGVMDALGIWHDAIRWNLSQLKRGDK